MPSTSCDQAPVPLSREVRVLSKLLDLHGSLDCALLFETVEDSKLVKRRKEVLAASVMMCPWCADEVRELVYAMDLKTGNMRYSRGACTAEQDLVASVQEVVRAWPFPDIMVDDESVYLDALTYVKSLIEKKN
jgi:hypothetical protein